MIKKKKFIFEERFLKKKFIKEELTLLVYKSLVSNYELKAQSRISYQRLLTTQQFHTRQKLRCFMTLSKRVPNSKLMLSRYYLVKYADKLHIGGIKKC